ncbi:MAG TPA: aminopeptidase P N-terminal domain-containing protein [Steroidobacteraceae bacterium]|jgi:hypothetical protein
MLLHSFSAPKSWSDSGFRQDSNFYYLTGLENLYDAILALDGRAKESWRFVMAPTERQQRRFAGMNGWASVYLRPDHQTEEALGIDHIVAWDGFPDFIETRRKANPEAVLYLDQAGRAGWLRTSAIRRVSRQSKILTSSGRQRSKSGGRMRRSRTHRPYCRISARSRARPRLHS